jgi:hypothetical protein
MPRFINSRTAGPGPAQSAPPRGECSTTLTRASSKVPRAHQGHHASLQQQSERLLIAAWTVLNFGNSARCGTLVCTDPLGLFRSVPFWLLVRLLWQT